MRVFNAERHIGEAIDCALAQTFTNFELIAIVDGATDSSLAILSSYTDTRIRIVEQDNCGRAQSAARGLAESNGEFVAILDADDRWAPDHLLLHVAMLDKDPSLALVGAATRIIDTAGNVVGSRTYPMSDRAIRRVALLYNPFAHSAVVFRRSTAVAVGGYDASHAHEDYGLWLRMLRLGTGANLALFSCDYRVSTRTSSDRIRFMLRGTIDMRRKAFTEYGYRRSLSTRALDTFLAVLACLPMRFVERVFRTIFYRASG